MKRIVPIIIFLTFLLGSCTQHDGDIGYLFGVWAMESRTLNGEPAPLEGRGVTFSFQNKVLLTQYLYTDPFDQTGNYGNFWHEGNELILKYMIKYDDDPSHSPINDGYNHQPPTWLGFPYTDQPIVLKILTLTRKSMVLQYTDDEGNVFVYSLGKVS